MLKKNIIAFLLFFFKKKVTIVVYHLFSTKWWNGKRAVLQKKYYNASGGIIEAGQTVTIEFKMQKKRFGNSIHEGLFYVSADHHTSMGGVNYNDLILV